MAPRNGKSPPWRPRTTSTRSTTRALSHAKAVFDIHRFFPAHLFHPPYGTRIQRLISKIFLGDADPSLAGREQASPNQPIHVPAFK